MLGRQSLISYDDGGGGGGSGGGGIQATPFATLARRVSSPYFPPRAPRRKRGKTPAPAALPYSIHTPHCTPAPKKRTRRSEGMKEAEENEENHRPCAERGRPGGKVPRCRGNMRNKEKKRAREMLG